MHAEILLTFVWNPCNTQNQ